MSRRPLDPSVPRAVRLVLCAVLLVALAPFAEPLDLAQAAQRPGNAAWGLSRPAMAQEPSPTATEPPDSTLTEAATSTPTPTETETPAPASTPTETEPPPATAAPTEALTEAPAATGTPTATDEPTPTPTPTLLEGGAGPEGEAGVALDGACFTDLGSQGLPAVYLLSIAWGDYDNDGRLDVLVSGYGGGYVTRVYHNNGDGTLTDINAGLVAVDRSAVAWGDYDSDGDLDILLSGETSSGRTTRIYRNDGNGVFTDIDAGLPGLSSSALAWGDYDNDGDLDILLTGYDGAQGITRLYRNDGNGVFTNVAWSLPGVYYGAVAWGDYDNDGDVDILLTGLSGLTRVGGVYRNDGNGAFADINAGLERVYYSAVAWGDYDSDGDLDILLGGYTGLMGTRLTRIYRNNGDGTFTNINAGLVGVDCGSVVWGDYDNDGDLDVALSGSNGLVYYTRVYRNNGDGTFSDTAAGLTGACYSSVTWTDYDGDGDLDILLVGMSGVGLIARLYRNDCAGPNTAPSAPSGLSATVGGAAVALSWTAASDTQTAAAGLSYNLRVGTAPGASDALSPMAAASGYRRLLQLGNAGPGTTATLALPAGTYYWSVQAVDTAWAATMWR